MKMLLLPLILLLVLPSPGEAQFSSDFPGVPRAAIGQHASSQGRFALDATGMRFSSDTEEATAADSMAASLRMGFGGSWRVASNWEVGFDFSFAEGRMVRTPPQEETEDIFGGSEGVQMDPAATLGYGLRLGVKLRPFAYVDPDGYGISAAVGFAIQPGLPPLLTYRQQEDSAFIGGLIGPDDAETPIEPFTSTQVMAGVSYRSSRAEADVAILVESLNDGAAVVSPVPVYDGTSFRLGARYRLTRSFALGGVFWGSGAPPWRDQVRLGAGGGEEHPFAVLLSFGSLLEERTDLMISSPSGDFSQSISLHLRVH